jgi:hypothetical protein
MLKPETMEAIYDAAMEILQTEGFREGEIACSGDIGMNDFAGFPVVIAAGVPCGELHVAYTDKMNRRHIVKVLNVANELEAIEAAKRTRRLGPTTAAEVLADYEFRKRVDAEMIKESREEFERGEITEDEVYEGDPLLRVDAYPLVFESEIRGQKIGAYIPVPTRVIKEEPDALDAFALPSACHLIQTEAVKYLDSLQ